MHRKSTRTISGRKLRLLALIPVLTILVFRGIAVSQPNDPVHRMLAAVERGAGDSVRALLPELKQAYPNNPGYIYLSAVTEPDGDRALREFQSIVQSYPSSEWADDAIMRLYQYHYAIGAYNTADRYWSRLETEYPSSPHLKEQQAHAVGAPATQGRDESVRFAVQIGLFADRGQADELLERMTKLGYSGELREKRVGEKALTAVWLGSFPSSDDARAFSKKILSRHRLESIVVKR